MEYSIYLNQPRCMEWKLTFEEAALCSYYANEHNWVRTKINDEEGDYLCITLAKLMKDLPIIGTTKFNFSKSLNSLVSKGLFDKDIDPDNSKTVFYRITPAAKIMWKYSEVLIASNLENRFLMITAMFKETQVLSNDNTISKRIQVFANENKVFANENKVFANENKVFANENKVFANANLSYNYPNTNPNTNHNIENDDDSFSENTTKDNLLRSEFDKLVNIYPDTINNSSKNLALAFGSYANLKAAQRVDLLKAAKNYSRTKQVKDHSANQTTNFIQSLNNFITKSFTSFIYGLPENYIYAEEFKDQKISNGAAVEILADMTVTINGAAVSIKENLKKFSEAKKIIENDKSFNSSNLKNYDDSKIKNLFNEIEFEIIENRIGGVFAINRFEAGILAETLAEYIAEGN